MMNKERDLKENGASMSRKTQKPGNPQQFPGFYVVIGISTFESGREAGFVNRISIAQVGQKEAADSAVYQRLMRLLRNLMETVMETVYELRGDYRGKLGEVKGLFS